MTDLAELRDKFKPREKVVTLLTGGDLLAEHEDLSRRLRGLLNRPSGDESEAREVAARIRAIEADLDATAMSFRFRGIGRNAFRRMLAEHPPADDRDGLPFDPESMAPHLIAACSVEPRMTADEARDLADMLTDGSWDALWTAAFDCCREVSGVPFNALASMPTPT